MMRPAATRGQRNHQPARVVRSVISSLFTDSPPKTPWDREPLLLPSPPCPSTPHAPHATTRVCFAVPRDISFPSPHSLADPALAPFPAPQPLQTYVSNATAAGHSLSNHQWIMLCSI